MVQTGNTLSGFVISNLFLSVIKAMLFTESLRK